MGSAASLDASALALASEEGEGGCGGETTDTGEAGASGGGTATVRLGCDGGGAAA